MPEDNKKSKAVPKVETIEITPIVQETTFEPHVGEYHMVSLDANGNEVAGSDFSISEKQYNKTYKGNNNFKVKKNPK